MNTKGKIKRENEPTSANTSFSSKLLNGIYVNKTIIELSTNVLSKSDTGCGILSAFSFNSRT
jgi:hypothetical protein